MKKIKFLLFITLLGLLSCGDDFLELVPETSIGVENFFNTEEDLQIYINSLYNFPGLSIYLNDRATDNATTTGNTELKTMMVTNPNSTTVVGGWNWGTLRSINLFLENFSKAQIAQDKLDHFEGLARFFRAQFYMGMVKRYSDVPYYDFVIETSDNDALTKPRDPRNMVVDMIFADYQFAIDHIYESQPSGMVNRWVAKAFMARSALYEGTFRKYHNELNLQGSADQYLTLARNISQDIIDNGPYAIHSTGNPDTDYGDLFTSIDLSSNSEVILAVFSENNVRNSGWSETIFGNFEVSPSKDLLQSYLMADGTSYTNQVGYETFSFVDEFQNRDPRLSQTYAYPGFNLVNTRTYSQGGGVYVQQLAKNFSGYHQIKGFINVTDQATVNSIDYPIIRLAEIMLTYAEAKAELGELTQADLDKSVNILRDRVGMPHMTTATTSDAVQQARYPGVEPIILEIRRERRVEMALEGYRYDDIMRYSAGSLLEEEPKGIYFNGLGNHDVTGDGIEDIVLLDVSESIPEPRGTNSLGVTLQYYKAGNVGESAGVFLSNGTSGHIITVVERGTFVEPKYYYRPIPAPQMALNPNFTQIFGWD